MHGNAQQTVGELAMQRELAEREFIKLTRHPITVSALISGNGIGNGILTCKNVHLICILIGVKKVFLTW